MRKDISTEHLKVSYQDRVAIVTLKRQQRNSWIDSMCVEFESVYQALDADDSVGAIIMTGNGSIFCGRLERCLCDLFEQRCLRV